MARSTATLLLFGILLAAGSWNYQQNLAVEAAERRPYRSYATAELDALQSAYASDLEQARAAYRAAGGAGGAAGGAGAGVRQASDLGGRVREFDRLQRIGRRHRELGMRVVERELEIEQLEAERQRRERDRHAALRFLRRLFAVRV